MQALLFRQKAASDTVRVHCVASQATASASDVLTLLIRSYLNHGFTVASKASKFAALMPICQHTISTVRCFLVSMRKREISTEDIIACVWACCS